MEAIINTSDKKIFQKILEYLRSLGVSVRTKNDEVMQGKFRSKEEFEALSGKWKDRNVTLDDLRSKAWPGRK